MKKPKGDYAIQTVTNALRVLDAFRDAGDYGVTELAKQLGLHKNNVFRLLATLEQHGYIEQSERNERYRLGARSLELGQAFLRSRSLLRQARPALEALSRDTGETAHLGLLRQFEVVFVDGAVHEQLVGTALRIGRRLPLHCTAAGKVLLGASPDGVREAYDRQVVGEAGLEACTPSTIVDPHKLFEHLQGVAVQGFATDVEECARGLSCAAAPVFDSSGQVVAALSVSAPSFRVSEDELLRDLVPAVCSSAEALSRELGYAA